jgi:HSP20 family molecular chaperone IbpA
MDPATNDVSAEKGLLTISGARTAPPVRKESGDVSVYAKERFDGRFRRVVSLLEDSDPLRLGETNSLVSLYAEVRASHYRRRFELSSELDTTAIDARLQDGVLTLRLAKLQRAKPRRIDVRAAG